MEFLFWYRHERQRAVAERLRANTGDNLQHVRRRAKKDGGEAMLTSVTAAG